MSTIELELKFVNEINKLEEHIEHMSYTSELLYDKDYHEFIINEYTNIVNDIGDSKLKKSDKIILIDRITVAFKENFLDMI